MFCFREIIFKSRCNGKRYAGIKVEGVHCDSVCAVGFLMNLIVTELVFNDQKNDDGGSKSQRQPHYINECITFVMLQRSEGDLNIIFKHTVMVNIFTSFCRSDNAWPEEQ